MPVHYRGRKHVFVNAARRSQTEHIADVDGTLLVDFVGRYERLGDDFEEVCRRIQLNSVNIPHRRRSSLPSGLPSILHRSVRRTGRPGVSVGHHVIRVSI